MSLDHDAIRKVYPQAVTIDDATGAFDEEGNAITLVQSDIDAARVTLNAEFNAAKYKTDREKEFASFGDQLDICLLYTSPSPRDKRQSRMPSSA